MLSSQHHSIIYKNYVVFNSVFINAESLHFGVPCGRFFHSAEATFHQPPQHLKQEYSFIPFHKSSAIAFMYWQMHTHAYYFVCEIYKIKPTLKCICSIHFKHQSNFVHSIQSYTCPVVHNLNIPLKETKYACGRFFHFDAFRSGRSLLSSAPDPSTPLHLHSISHLSSKSKSASHPCPLLQIPIILQNQPSIFNIEN